MNVIQMLNTWRWFWKETFEPLIKNEPHELPTWFWGDTKDSSWYWNQKKTMKVEKDNHLSQSVISLSDYNREGYPCWVYIDAFGLQRSDWRSDYHSSETPRSWLSREENKALGIEDD